MNIPSSKYIDVPRLARAFNVYFDLGLIMIDISVQDENDNPELVNCLGLHYPTTGKIIINSILLSSLKWLTNTILHEMIHRYLCVNKRGHKDRDPEFIQFAKDLGFSHNLMGIEITVDYSTIQELWNIYHTLLTWRKPKGINLLTIKHYFNFYPILNNINNNRRKAYTNILCYSRNIPRLCLGIILA